MKLIELFENEELHKKQLIDLFSDAREKTLIDTYIFQKVFEIRVASEGEVIEQEYPGVVAQKHTCSNVEYVLRDKNEIKNIKVISEVEFKKFDLVEANAKPDAEGFLDYRVDKKIQAFQYTEMETLNFDINGNKIQISTDDYIGHPINNTQNLIVYPKIDFEETYRLA